MFVGSGSKQKTPEKLIGFTTIDSIVAFVYPESNVEIDTIFPNETNEYQFVYDSDTITIENLFLPMFPEPDEKDIETLKIIADTPYLYYKKQTLAIAIRMEISSA